MNTLAELYGESAFSRRGYSLVRAAPGSPSLAQIGAGEGLQHFIDHPDAPLAQLSDMVRLGCPRVWLCRCQSFYFPSLMLRQLGISSASLDLQLPPQIRFVGMKYLMNFETEGDELRLLWPQSHPDPPAKSWNTRGAVGGAPLFDPTTPCVPRRPSAAPAYCRAGLPPNATLVLVWTTLFLRNPADSKFNLTIGDPMQCPLQPAPHRPCAFIKTEACLHAADVVIVADWDALALPAR